MKTARLLIFIAFLLTPSLLKATSIDWLLHAEYDKIDYYDESMLKCWKEGKIQLVNMAGEPLFPRMVDSVTNYSDGYALVLDKVKRGYRIYGILDERSHNCQMVDGNYFTDLYSFYSEGYVSVADVKGKLGYLDTQGQLAIKCKYKEARPFRRGWASVFITEGEAFFIDAWGNVLDVRTHVSEASSFNDDGEALVVDYQSLKVINTDGEVVRKYTMSGQDFPIRTYDFVFDEEGDKFTPETNRLPKQSDSYKIFADRNGMYGIESKGQSISIAQFDEIGFITESNALVRKGRYWGVVSFVFGDYFANLSSTTILSVQRKEIPEIICDIISPARTGSPKLILIDRGDGAWMPVTIKDGHFGFVPVFPADASECQIRIQVRKEDIVCWENEQVIREIPVKITVGKPYLESDFANSSDIQKVKAIVTNHSDVEIPIHVNISSVLGPDSENEIKSRSNETKTLEANESMDCTIVYRVVDEEEVVVNLTVTYGNTIVGSNSTTVSLKPFY